MILAPLSKIPGTQASMCALTAKNVVGQILRRGISYGGYFPQQYHRKDDMQVM